MTDLAQQIRARLEADQAHRYSAGVGAVEYRTAIRAVLELHKPVPGDASWCDKDGFTWPCQTVRAIADALAGQDGQRPDDPGGDT